MPWEALRIVATTLTSGQMVPHETLLAAIHAIPPSKRDSFEDAAVRHMDEALSDATDAERQAATISLNTVLHGRAGTERPAPTLRRQPTIDALLSAAREFGWVGKRKEAILSDEAYTRAEGARWVQGSTPTADLSQRVRQAIENTTGEYASQQEKAFHLHISYMRDMYPSTLNDIMAGRKPREADESGFMARVTRERLMCLATPLVAMNFSRSRNSTPKVAYIKMILQNPDATYAAVTAAMERV